LVGAAPAFFVGAAGAAPSSAGRACF
jgi:hypothetical protein